MPKLTDQFAASAKCPEGKDRHYFRDDHLPGFALLVWSTGNKVWYFNARINYKLYNRKLGSLSVMNCHQARQAAKQVAGQLTAGVDVVSERRKQELEKIEQRKAIKAATTIAQATAKYFVESDIKATTIKFYSKLLGNGLAQYATVPVCSIDGDWITEVYKEISDRVSPLHATRCINFVRTICLAEGYDNPIPTRLKKAQSKPRQSRLEPSDGRELWRALAPHTNTSSGAYLAVLMLTGCRTTELSALTVRDVDMAEGCFKLPDTKNGRSHKVYMSDVVAQIIGNMVKGKGDTELVFRRANGGRETRHKMAYHKTWSNHDLRKMVAIAAIDLEISYPIIKAMLNHSTTDVTIKHYAHATPSQLREAWQKITDHYTEKKCTTSTSTKPTLYALPSASISSTTFTTSDLASPVKPVSLRIA